MIICGSDIGSVNNGFCVYDTESKHFLDMGDITTDNKIFDDRLIGIEKAYNEVFNKYAPTIWVYENPIFNGRGENGALLNQAVGVMRLAARKINATVRSYTATQVKAKVTGSGKADKHLIASTVSKIFNIPNEFTSNHVSDSVAVLACYLIDNNLLNK